LGFAEELIKDIMADPRGPRVIGVLIRELTKEKQAGIRQGRVKALLAVAEWCDDEVAELMDDDPFNEANNEQAHAYRQVARHCRAEAAEPAREGDAIEDKSNE
jgi:hypothetical protein